MKIIRSTGEFDALPKDYPGLCRKHLPRPISDRAEYENTAEITDLMAGHQLTADQEDYFDLLCQLIEDYEKKQGAAKMPKVSGTEALKHLLESHGQKAADLSRMLGSHRSLGAMILRGERRMTLKHVAILSRHFGVSADLFLA